MKKIFLTTATIATILSATAQSSELVNRNGIPILPTAGFFAFGLDATPILGGVFGNSTAVAPRFDGAFLGKYFVADNLAHRFTASLNLVNIRDANTAIDNDVITAIGLSWGMERRFGSTRLQGFFGGQVEIAVLNVRDYSNTFILHPSVFVGTEYFFAPGFSIGSGVGWGINFSRITIDNNATSLFGFGNFGGGITLMFHFNRRQERIIPTQQFAQPIAVAPPAITTALATIVQPNQDDLEIPPTPPTQVAPQILPIQTCSERQPSWGESLGTITFITNTTWTVGSQVWSDAVHATNCDKTNFSSIRRDDGFYSDCRSSPNSLGSLFSWCAVVRFQQFLCPYPWRVPTQQDFTYLDRELGGDGRRVQNNPHLVNRYLNAWGAAVVGFANHNNEMRRQQNTAMYWSQTQSNVTNAFSIDIRTSGEVRATSTLRKVSGLSLRCVRDI
jgi:uncharacterized protein (TIGR02145 family)